MDNGPTSSSSFGTRRLGYDFLVLSNYVKLIYQRGNVLIDDGHLAGLHEFPQAWYTEIQRVLWPLDDPKDFGYLFQLCQFKVSFPLKSHLSFPKEALTMDMATTIKANYDLKGSVFELATFFKKWQRDRHWVFNSVRGKNL